MSIQSAGPVLKGQAAASTATGLFHTGPCKLAGILVTASSSGVLSVYDNTTNSGKLVMSSKSVSANTYYPIAAADGAVQMTNGVYVVLVSGTASFEPLFAD